MPIFVDTSAWYALLDKTDSDHASAVKFKDSLNHSIVTMNYIADEIITLTKAAIKVSVLPIAQVLQLWNDLESSKLQKKILLIAANTIHIFNIGYLDFIIADGPMTHQHKQ